MKKVLIVIDDTKTSKAVLSTFQNSVWHSESVILLYVERLMSRSLMIDMLGEAELSTLKESLHGTEYMNKLSQKAGKILSYYRNEVGNFGAFGITTLARVGNPVEEILKVADEEHVDMILLGLHRLTGINRLFFGSIAEDLQKKAAVPVLLAKRPNVCEEKYSWYDAYAAVTVTTLIVLGLFLLGVIL